MCGRFVASSSYCDTSVKKMKYMKNSPFSLNSGIEECSRCSLLRYHWLGFCITRKMEGQKQGKKSITSLSLKASLAFSLAFSGCFPNGTKEKVFLDLCVFGEISSPKNTFILQMKLCWCNDGNHTSCIQLDLLLEVYDPALALYINIKG